MTHRLTHNRAMIVVIVLRKKNTFVLMLNVFVFVFVRSGGSVVLAAALGDIGWIVSIGLICHN